MREQTFPRRNLAQPHRGGRAKPPGSRMGGLPGTAWSASRS